MESFVGLGGFGGVDSYRLGEAWKRRHRFWSVQGRLKDPAERHLTPDRETLAARATELRPENVGACIRARDARVYDSAM